MVIIATPIINVRKVLEEIAPHLQRGAVVTDTASTKREVIRWADSILPAHVHFVGGHPMAGKEKSGPAAAEETLFDGRPYCIVPSVNAGGGAVNAIVGLVEAVGAQPVFLDADEHDAYAAAISHVPLIASIALFRLVRSSSAWEELGAMSGPAFRDLTRLASGEPEMSHDIFMTNRAHVLHWLERYMTQLKQLSDLIEKDDSEALFRFLAETQLERDEFIVSPPKRKEPGPANELPSVSETFVGMMTGSLWANRTKEITDAIEEQRQAREREERLHRRE
jgi:prephenate dehydrogenase